MADRRLPVGSLIIAGLLVLVGVFLWTSERVDAHRDALQDSLRTERLAATAASMGWSVALTAALDENRSLAQLLQERTDSLDSLSVYAAELAREVELMGGDIRSLSRMYLEAVGAIERHEAVAHVGAGDTVPDSITGHVRDSTGLLEADVTATVDPPSVAIPSFTIALELLTSVAETPDGRALFLARASDPRVTVSHRETYWVPPAPVAYCSVGTRAKWGLGGAVAGALGWEIAR